MITLLGWVLALLIIAILVLAFTYVMALALFALLRVVACLYVGVWGLRRLRR